MKKLSVLALVLGVVLIVPQLRAEPPGARDAAEKSARAWLALVDGKKYDASWDQAASLFRKAVEKKQWSGTIESVRDPLGKVLSRKLVKASYSESLPGAPDGKYVVIQFETKFEHKSSAVETITPMMDTDGSWRVSGYFIK